jgi:penicillin-binding protein 1A
VLRATLALLAGGLAIAVLLVCTGLVLRELPKVASMDPNAKIYLPPPATRSVIYGSTGQEMAVLAAEQDREEVPLDKVPKEVVTSVLGIEDANFYSHHGINLKSGFRALFADVSEGAAQQGGSTITQQLIKNTITGNDKTLDRKLREAVLAYRLEDQMSKNEILERYLNIVYLGHGAYGVQAAAETYFNKNVEDLGWPEAALLTALIRNPVGYDPIRNPKLAAQRRTVVVNRLVRIGKLTDAQAKEILATPLPTKVFKRAERTASAQLVGGSYFTEEVKQILLDMPELGPNAQERYDAVFGGGLKVYTTYDPAAQAAAEDAVKVVPDSGGDFFAGLAALDPTSSAVRAMVGGPDFTTSKVNYVTQGWRQPGSSFKTLVLLAALEAGYVPSDTISGSTPCRFPNESDEKGYSEVKGGGRTADLTSQTASSSNCAYMRLGQTVGLDKVAALAEKLGVNTVSDKRGPSGELVEIPMTEEIPLTLPIGSQEVHPMAMAGAYAAIANDGVYRAPYYIDKITNSAGKVLYEHVDPGVRVFSTQTARLATQVLAKNVTSGTGKNARLSEQVAAGKTGTTQQNADAWFVGYTPRLVTAVWLGSPDDREAVRIKGASIMGGNYPAKVWKAFNEVYHQDLEPVEFLKAETTRKGKAIRYTNKYDKGSTTKKKTTAPKAATTAPDAAPAPAPDPAPAAP